MLQFYHVTLYFSVHNIRKSFFIFNTLYTPWKRQKWNIASNGLMTEA